MIAGIKLAGANQWEFQVGPCVGIDARTSIN
jgi:hypothetical protein